MQLTAGQSFYYRLSRAVEAADFAAVAGFYHPDAVLASLSTGRALRGRAEIIDSLRDTVDAAGPVRPISAESFLEYGDLLAVEATVATRFAELQTYDLYVLRAGRISHQFSGLFSPRRPVAPIRLGPPSTPEQRTYERLRRALEEVDAAELRSLYRPDAVAAAVGLGTVVEGRDAIVERARQTKRGGDPGRFKALVGYVEAPGLIAVESVHGYQFGGSGLIPDTDVVEASCVVLLDGAVRLQFEVIVSPRLSEILAMVRKRQESIARTRQRAIDLTFPRYRPW